MLKKAMGQITDENSMKPVVEEKKQIETDMELYLIGNKDQFYKNLQKNRVQPDNMTTIQINDMNTYFGTDKKDNNTLLSML